MLRSVKNQNEYREFIKKGGLENICPLCKKSSIKDFLHWRIVKNDFPYDTIAKTNDILILKRHGEETSLKEEKELKEIKKGFLNENYDFIIEALPDEKSIPGHFHVQLIVSKSKF